MTLLPNSTRRSNLTERVSSGSRATSKHSSRVKMGVSFVVVLRENQKAKGSKAKAAIVGVKCQLVFCLACNVLPDRRLCCQALMCGASARRVNLWEGKFGW